jgi:hypothetical protein
MTDQLMPFDKFSPQDVQDLLPAMKVGIMGTVTSEGLPHLTLITTMMASDDKTVVWGQFMEGLSKENVKRNPKTGFMIMSLAKDFWRGKANYTHAIKSGKDYDFYNNTPLFRYNAYFGVHTAHYMDLVAQTGKYPLPMGKIITAAIKTMAVKAFLPRQAQAQVLNGWSKAFYDKIDNLKFLGYVGADGYPVIIPLIQAQSLDAEHLLFSFGAFGDELARIPAYTPVAIFGMALSMEDVLVRGTYQGAKRLLGLKYGVVQLEYAYNPMPPVPQQIYPEVALETVREF